MKISIKQELKKLYDIIKSLDKNVVIIFISVAILQTISWYYTSRRFFRDNFFYTLFDKDPNVYLYEYLYWFISDVFTLMIIPLLLVIFIHKSRPREYGFRLGEKKLGLQISFIFFLIMLPIVWFASSTGGFAAKYPHLHAAKTNWNIFLIYETGMLLYMFAWEYIWRGYMLFGLEKKFGYYAVLIQMIPFLILHNGKPAPETFGAIIAGIALGILALRTRSFIYGAIVHFGVMISIDFISALRFRANDFGVGLKSLFNIFSGLF